MLAKRIGHMLLIALDGFLAVTTVAGGIGLLTGAIAPGLDLLEGSPFTSYTIPGLSLLILVGGSALVATGLMLRRHLFGVPASAVAGVMIMGFEIVEVLVIGSDPGVARNLQIFYFILGLLTAALAAGMWVSEHGISLAMYHRNRNTIPWLLVMSLSIILVFAIAGTAFAVEFRAGDTVTIGEGEVIDDDLAVSGNTIIVDGTVNGDLVATGARVVINGRINGSLMMAGQTLELNGQVGGTVYSGAAALTIGPNAQVERSLFFGGYSYASELGSTIGRDNIVAGYQAVFNGEVRRNLQAYISALELNGAVGGNVDAFVDRPGTIADTQFWSFFAAQGLPPALIPGLRVGPEATIGGQFRYTSPVEQTGAILAKPERGIVYSAPAPVATGATSVAAPSTARNESLAWFWARLREFISLLVIGGLALWLLPVWFNKVAERTQTQPWLAAVWGFVVGVLGYAGALLAAFLVILVVAGLAALTLGGLAMSVFSLGFSVLGLFFTLFSIFAAYGSKVVVLYPLSHTICERFAPSLNRYSFVPLGLGVLVFVLLRSIPFLGVLIEIGVTLVGLGALWLSFRAGYARPRPEAGALGTRPTLAPAPV